MKNNQTSLKTVIRKTIKKKGKDNSKHPMFAILGMHRFLFQGKTLHTKDKNSSERTMPLIINVKLTLQIF